jgi:7-cyano-7-deazaguanine reductase
MPTIQDLQKKYEALNDKTVAESEERIDPSRLLCFDYEYPGQDTEVAIDTDEFTAVCPWTGLPDTGTLKVSYVPDRLCIELKSLKYYLLSYRNVGIVQEHAANRILNDLVEASKPLEMTVTLDYRVRGGLHTVVTARYTRP